MKKLPYILTFTALTLFNSCNLLEESLDSKYQESFRKGEKEFYYNPKKGKFGQDSIYNIMEISDNGDTILYKTHSKYNVKKEREQSFKLEKMKIMSKNLDTTIKDKDSKALYYHEGHLNWAFGFDRHLKDSKEIF